MRSTAVAALLFAALLSGCLSQGFAPAASPGPTATHAPTSGSRSSTASHAPSPPPAAHGNQTGPLGNATPPASGPPRAWAQVGAATIRPGVQIVIDGSQCTSNFLFTSPDNATVYIGFAAHCVTKNDPNAAADGCDPASGPLEIGHAVKVEGADKPAHLAYTSWGTMQKVGKATSQECLYNDFAFAALDPVDAAKANPAMLFFGGPTAVQDPKGVAMLDKVMTYGDSGLRMGISALSPHEGYVVFTPGSGGWTTEVYTLPQGIPGDSGSGVLMADGSALGILVTISYAGGSNGVTTLDNAMAYAASAGLPLHLATADLISAGRLPPV